MPVPEGERLARLEAENEAIRGDIAEIKDALKKQADALGSLKDIASRGGGAFHAILMLGGLIGWIVGLAAAVWSVAHSH